MLDFRDNSKGKYQAELERCAWVWQLGLYKRLADQPQILELSVTDDDARFIIAGIANWIFRFGDYGPKVAKKPGLKESIDSVLPYCARALEDDDGIVEVTFAIIIAAAAQNIDMRVFTTHFDRLVSFGIVKKSINLYLSSGQKPVHIDEFLRGQHSRYYYYVQYGEG